MSVRTLGDLVKEDIRAFKSCRILAPSVATVDAWVNRSNGGRGKVWPVEGWPVPSRYRICRSNVVSNLTRPASTFRAD